MPLTFSVAQIEQSEAISHFVNSAYRGDVSRKGWTTEADLLDGQRIDPQMVREIINSPDQVVLIAYDTKLDQMVGCVNLERVNHSCHLGMLTVKPNLQNKGLGRTLLAEAESWARGWGCSEVILGVLAPRRELIDWYSRRGYRITGERKDFPYGDTRFGLPIRKDLFFLFMKKTL